MNMVKLVFWPRNLKTTNTERRAIESELAQVAFEQAEPNISRASCAGGIW